MEKFVEHNEHPSLKETLKPLVEDFLQNEDPSTTWSVMPENIDLMHARRLIEETRSLGVILPQRAKNLLKCISPEEYQTRYQAALLLWFIGLQIKGVEKLDNKRRLGSLRDFSQIAGELELGELDTEKLIGE